MKSWITRASVVLFGLMIGTGYLSADQTVTFEGGANQSINGMQDGASVDLPILPSRGSKKAHKGKHKKRAGSRKSKKTKTHKTKIKLTFKK